MVVCFVCAGLINYGNCDCHSLTDQTQTGILSQREAIKLENSEKL